MRGAGWSDLARSRHGGVEKAFGLAEGTGVQVMTEQEWLSHQQKMSAMKPGERKRYQQEVRQRIAERIKTGRAPVAGETASQG